VPVIAGVGFNQHLAVELARAATDAGADGILAFPPYFPNADDEGMLAYYRAIGAASNLGTLIYSRDWANFSPLMVERLTDIPNLIGWKDGQGDIRRLQMIMNRVGERLAMDWRRRRRHGSGVLLDRHSRLHLEHRQRGAASLVATARAGSEWFG
jgi:5-dehydro-4-deoxyglucarate dehydratase